MSTTHERRLTIEELAAKLGGKPTGPRQWLAKCPSHTDDKSSLSIGEGAGGRKLLHCHAGCTVLEIIHKAGIPFNDLRGDDAPQQKRPPRIVAEYDYCSADGELLYQTVRFDPKDFRQRRPDGKGGWVWDIENVQRVLYRLPELLESECEWTFIAEGEKDVDNLWKLGLPATCGVGGASKNPEKSKWRSEYNEHLHGRRVCIVADKDAAGRAHAFAVAKSLDGTAAEVKVVELPGGAVKDASDWISCGGTADQLMEIANSAPAFDPTTPPAASPATAAEPEADDQAADDDAVRANPRMTELGNAERFIHQHGERVLFCAGRWHGWDGIRWKASDCGEVERLAHSTARSLWREAENAPPEMQLPLAKFAKKSESSSAISATLKLAQAMRSVRPCDLDAEPMKLNTLSGIIDLCTGRLHPHDPAALMTKLSPVAYAGLDTPAPMWEKFMHRIMDGSEALIGYLQRLVGMWLTGDIATQEFWVLWGSGANGKSVFSDTLLAAMGDYAGSAPNSLLTHRRGGFGEHPTEIMDLCGKRLVIGSETEEGAELRVQLVKQVTGNATLKGRFMQCDYVEFPRTHKLILVTNNRPLIRETTNAVWRRVRLIPFAVVLPPEEWDLRLSDKLKAEWPGILAWAVRGCLDWQRTGLQTPSEVTVATGAYQLESDALGEYLADRCVRGPGVRIQRNDLHADYMSYCAGQGDKFPLPRNVFFDRIRRVAGVSETQVRICGTGTRVFVGIGLAAVTV